MSLPKGYNNYPNRYYPWSEREDPCKLAYYASNKNTIVRNVLASNMGIIAISVFIAMYDILTPH